MAADATSTAASAAASGIGAATVALIGVDLQALFWAFVGSGVGVSISKPAGRTRALLVFAFVVMGSALLGTWAAHWQFGSEPTARNAISLVLGIFFHPLLAAALAQIEPLLRGWADRIGARR